MELVTTGGVGDDKLGIVNAREVKGASGLHLAHGETERPRVGGEIIEDVVGEICAMHLRHDVVMIDVRCVFEKGRTVDVKRRGIKVELFAPCATNRFTGYKVERLDWVVEVGEIDIRVGVGGELVLSLCDQEFMFSLGEELTLFGIEVDVVTIDLGGAPRGEVIPALDTNLNIVVLEGNKGERLGPVFTEEEGDHVIVTRVVFLAGVRGHSERRLGGRITHEGVMNTLDVERVELRHLLTTDPEREFSGARGVVRV